MKQLKQFGSKEVGILRAELEKVLDSFSKKFKVDVTLGNIGYNSQSASGKVSFAIKGATPEYISSKGVVTLPPVGTQFVIMERRFEITSHAPSRPKFPIIAYEIGNPDRFFKFTAERVAAAIVLAKQ